MTSFEQKKTAQDKTGLNEQITSKNQYLLKTSHKCRTYLVWKGNGLKGASPIIP